MSKYVIAGALVVAALGLAARRVEPQRIAVVDISRLVAEHKKSREEQKLIDEWKVAKQQQLDDMQQRLKDKIAEIEQFKPDSDEARRRTRELKVEKYAYESEANSLGEEAERRIARSLCESHARVAAACKVYLETSDLDVILQYAPSPVEGTKRSEVIPEIVVRTVVAYKKPIDATNAVLEILDAAK